MDHFNVERIPLPRFSTYVFYTLISLFGSVLRFCYTSFMDDTSSDVLRSFSVVEDPWLFWSIINFAYCLLICVGRELQRLFFGELRDAENALIRENLSNFIFYKVVFVYGILSVEALHELLLWASWFSVLGFLHLLVGLVKERSEFILQSSGTPFLQPRMLCLLGVLLIFGNILMAVSVAVGTRYSWNLMFFMLAEVFQFVIRTIHIIMWYAIQLYSEAVSHSKKIDAFYHKSVPIYYTEIVFSCMADISDVVHCLHLLFWNNVKINVSGIIVGMHLQHLYHKLSKRYHRHRQYQKIVRFLRWKCLHVLAPSEDCVVCWEKLTSAVQLPCGHFFHMPCLCMWIERIPNCPVCRHVLDFQSLDHHFSTRFNNLLPQVTCSTDSYQLRESGEHRQNGEDSQVHTQCDSESPELKLASLNFTHGGSFKNLTMGSLISQENPNTPSAILSIHNLLNFSDDTTTESIIQTGASSNIPGVMPGNFFESLENELLQCFRMCSPTHVNKGFSPSRSPGAVSAFPQSSLPASESHVRPTDFDSSSDAAFSDLLSSERTVNVHTHDGHVEDLLPPQHVLRLVIKHLIYRVADAMASIRLVDSGPQCTADNSSHISPEQSHPEFVLDSTGYTPCDDIRNSSASECCKPAFVSPDVSPEQKSDPSFATLFPLSAKDRAAMLERRKVYLRDRAKSAFMEKHSVRT